MTKIEMHQRLQPLYKKMMGHDIRILRTVPNVKVDGISVYCPLPIDPVNPERGLWRMVDWEPWYHGITAKGDLWFNWGGLDKDIRIEAQDPEEALLKALLKQENL